jgi:hypothetical protein
LRRATRWALLQSGSLSFLTGSASSLEIATAANYDRVEVSGIVKLGTPVSLSLALAQSDGTDPVDLTGGGGFHVQRQRT